MIEVNLLKLLANRFELTEDQPVEGDSDPEKRKSNREKHLKDARDGNKDARFIRIKVSRRDGEEEHPRYASEPVLRLARIPNEVVIPAGLEDKLKKGKKWR